MSINTGLDQGGLDGSCHVPAVLIVVHGGPNTIRIARDAVCEDKVDDCAIPVVVIQGSGGAADILARAMEENYDSTENIKQKFEESVRAQFNNLSKVYQDSIIRNMWDCVKHKSMVRIFLLIQKVYYIIFPKVSKYSTLVCDNWNDTLSIVINKL